MATRKWIPIHPKTVNGLLVSPILAAVAHPMLVFTLPLAWTVKAIRSLVTTIAFAALYGLLAGMEHHFPQRSSTRAQMEPMKLAQR